jgi:hypothetical protein
LGAIGRMSAISTVEPSARRTLPPARETLSFDVSPTDRVRRQVSSLLEAMYPRHAVGERRRQERMPFPHLVYVTPVAEDGETPCVGTLVAAGKHVSDDGLGFYHPDPLPFRQAIVSLEQPVGQWHSFLIELRWCRFIRQGWYESGGRFVRPAPTPPGHARWSAALCDALASA